MDIDGFCKLVLDYYKCNEKIRRKDDFNYDDFINKVKYSN
jgi:hypothetical protein